MLVTTIGNRLISSNTYIKKRKKENKYYNSSLCDFSIEFNNYATIHLSLRAGGTNNKN